MATLEDLIDQRSDGDARRREDAPPDARREAPPALVKLRDGLWWVRPVVCVALGALLGYYNLEAWETSAFLRVPALLASLILVAQGPLDFGRQSRWEGLQQRQFSILSDWRTGLAAYKDRLDERERSLDVREGRAGGHADDAEGEHDQHGGRDGGDSPAEGRAPITVLRAENVFAEAPREPAAPSYGTPNPTTGGGQPVSDPAPAPAEVARLRSEVTRLEEEIRAQTLLAKAVRGTSDDNRTGVLLVLILAIWLGLATLSYSSAPETLLRLSLLASFLLFASAWGMLQKDPA